MPNYFAETIDTLVEDALSGYASVNSAVITVVEEPLYVAAVRRNPNRRVGIVSGGGSGHEPLHVGFVGEGMLDAACPGKIFTSPHNRQVYAASRAVAGSDGVLHIVKNYTGDTINFAIAAERLAHDGIRCARIIVDDDLATDSESVAIGRRGTGATVLIEKILGAAADRGAGLDELVELGTSLSAAMRSVAVASAAHTSPQTGSAAFELQHGTVEYGVGIHGERSDQTRRFPNLDTLVENMVSSLVQSLRDVRGEAGIVLVNNLGGMTELEAYAVASRALNHFSSQGVSVKRTMVGSYVTALDMRGFSLSLARIDEAVLGLWDAPAYTVAWPST